MKFTNGYWLTRKEINPIYAVEYSYHRIVDDALVIYAVSTHISGKGDTVNVPMITVTLSSPMKDVIRTEIVHFKGDPARPPFFEISTAQREVEIEEDDEVLTYRAGKTEAVICKRPESWQIEYYYDGKLLTQTGYRNIARMLNRQTGKTYMTEQLAVDIDEQIYGLGERFTPFVKNGQRVDMWNEDGGTSSEISYKNIPFYISSRGYGVLVDNAGDVSFEIASEKVERIQFSVEGENIAYYMIGAGTPKEVISVYTAMTGRPALPPAWTFGLWLTTSFSTDYDECIITGFLDEMQERDIPLSVFHFDCFWMHGYEWSNLAWNEEVFPDPEQMLERYHKRGLKTCVWINPFIAQNSRLFDEAMENGYLIRKKDGRIWQTDMWQAGMGVVDFTNPEAVKWYQEKLEALIDMGVDSFKTDFGERIPVNDILYHDGSDPVKMHNYYAYLYNRAVFSALEKKLGKNNAALFARAATTGSQQFPVHWGGDCSATYPSMAETLRGGLSLGMGGFGFWSHDMGGFEQFATPDIYKRWCAFGLLSSHSRLHGGKTYRVPWLFDEESCSVLSFFAKLKCRMMPYLFGHAIEAHESGIPMLRAMVLEYPEDRACRYLDLQYMLGDSLLVAPIFRESGEVEYYLPEGKWVHLLDNRIEQGGCWKKETYDYMSLPLFVRQNTIMLFGECDQSTEYDYAKEITVVIPEFEESAKSERMIPTKDGRCAAVVRAWRRGSEIEVEVSKDIKWNIKKIGTKEKSVEIKGRKAVICLA